MDEVPVVRADDTGSDQRRVVGALDVGDAPAQLLGDAGADPAPLPMHDTAGTTGRRTGMWSGVPTDDDACPLATERGQLWCARPER